jgi:DNA-binding NarL/FixJ family response regulator
MKRTRVLVADDHSVVRSGIRTLLQSSQEFVIVAEAENGREALELAEEHKPDIVLMDISMPEMNGIEATSLLKQRNPEIKVVILTIHADEEYVFQILRAGASGYLLKSAGKKEIFAAIKSAMSGERFFSPGISDLIIEGFVHRAQVQSPQAAIAAPASPTSQLTKREEEVLTLIAQGYTNRKIADALFLSVRTINTHRTNLMKKLDIHDTARLVRYAIETGLVKLTS